MKGVKRNKENGFMLMIVLLVATFFQMMILEIVGVKTIDTILVAILNVFMFGYIAYTLIF